MTYRNFRLEPAAPDQRLGLTVYDDGGLGFTSIGPKGGYYNMSVPRESVAPMMGFIIMSGPMTPADWEMIADALDIINPDTAEASERAEELANGFHMFADSLADARGAPDAATIAAGLAEAMGGPIATDTEIERTRDALAAKQEG